jgi:hypothetical protein
MNPSTFSPEEQEVLRQCVSALKSLPVFKSGELESIFDISKDEIDEVLNTFPEWDLYDEEPNCYDGSGDLVRNAFAWLMNGSPEEKMMMRKEIICTDDLLQSTYEKVQHL